MKKQLQTLIADAISSLSLLEHPLSPESIHIEHTRDPKFGDFATNIAMMLSKQVKKNPRELAAQIISALPDNKMITKTEVAGPGFINFFIADSNFLSILPDILDTGKHYGRHQQGDGKRVQIEFVSANPTGPLHVGHGRGAAYGASVADLLAAIGYTVHREYYLNDAGRQMHILAVSVWLRYLEYLGETLTFPANGYKGDYVSHIARDIKIEHGNIFARPLEDIFSNLPDDETEEGIGNKDLYIDALIERTKILLGTDAYNTIFNNTLEKIRSGIQKDLEDFGVHYQNWFSETQLHENGAIEKGISLLREKGHIYEKEGAHWFEATKFGDEKDRVVQRANGQYTYFGSDIAYHLHSYSRGFDQLIDVFGADHHGYAPRINAFLTACDCDTKKLTTLLVQFAILYRGKTKVPMSTRGGEFVTLRELYEEVGKDAARFFYIMRKPEQHLDFDLELAKAQSADNPVYYIQYAHARICSVFRQLEETNSTWNKEEGLHALHLLNADHEKQLARQLARYPAVVLTAASQYAPHLLAHYLRNLANFFHSYYNNNVFLVDDQTLRQARLTLIRATQQVLSNGLELLGVSAPERM